MSAEQLSEPSQRESGLLEAMVDLADTLIGEFDLVDMTTLLVDRCVALLAVDAAGLVLSDGLGGLQVMASTTEATHRIETHQVNLGEGPCVDAYWSGSPSSEPDLAGSGRWPRFAAATRAGGFRAVHALPLDLRGQTIGALNLFSVTTGSLSSADQQAARALTHMTTVAVVQYRALHESQVLNQQLQVALSTRISIEQAKGRLVERGHLATPEDAFALLRGYARNTNQRVTDVAEAVMNDTIDTAPILTPAPSRPRALEGQGGHVRHGHADTFRT